MKFDNRGLLTILGVLVIFLLLGPVLMGGMMGTAVVGPGMMGWGYAAQGGATTGNGWVWGLGMGLGGIMMLVFWGALILGAVLLVRRTTGHDTSATGGEDPLIILRRRYAAGEIDQPTYERMNSELGNTSITPRQPMGTNGRTEVRR